MRVTALVSLAVVLLAAPPAALAVDYEEYARLQDRAIELFDAVQGEDVPADVREDAIAAYLAVIDWLDTFFADPAFADLPAEHQAAAYSDRYRWEYNLSRQLILLGRCEEARDRIRTLLDSPVSDPELRPHLAEAFEEALACLARPRMARLVIESTPSDAEVLVDGVFAGLATAPLDVELGSHTVVLQAEGYENAAFDIEAESEGQEIALGPIALTESTSASESGGPEAARKLPEWHEWTLWGVGAAGIATGVILLVDAANLQNTLDSPPDGMIVSDPEREQDEIDTQRLIGYVAGGLGLACAITGTILYFVRDSEQESAEQPIGLGGVVGPTGAQVWLGLTF